MKNDESVALQQQESPIPEISVNFLPITTTTSSILGKLMPKSQQIDTTTTKQHLHLGEIFSSLLDSKFPQLKRHRDDDFNEDYNEISPDMLEIEMPVVGNEYAKNYQVDVDRLNNEINNMPRSDMTSEEDGSNKVSEGYVEISLMPETTTISEQSMEVTNNFQSSTDRETTFKNYLETTPPHSSISSSKIAIDMEGVESKLMNSYGYADDDRVTTGKPLEFYSHGKRNPMNVVIYLNSHGASRYQYHPRCKQVHTPKHDYDIFPEYTQIDSDEDLFFKNDPSIYVEKRNQLKRAADAGFFSSATSLTPAPRNSMSSLNFNTIRKPSFIERLESESSVERTERLNKGLGDLMKFIAVWAHVDKFVSDRARSIVKKLAYMSDDDYGDIVVGSPRKHSHANHAIEDREILKNSMAKIDNEPFT